MTKRKLTRRHFLIGGGTSALAMLLEACRAPSPTPDPNTTPIPIARSSPTPSNGFDVFLPHIGGDTEPTLTPTPANTSTPAPSPTPRRTFPAYDRPSKLGIAIQRFRERQIMDRIIADGKPRVVKIFDDLGAASEIKQLSPDTIIIGHIDPPFDFQHEITSGATDMRALAADFIAKNLEKYQLNAGIDYWEGYNEPVFENEAKMALYGQFEAERVRQMDALGYQCAIGNFSTGTPPLEQWNEFFPALEAAQQYGALLALHEYSAPTMDFGYDPALREGWLTCRYRKVYREYVPPSLHVPIVITETGVDGLVGNRPGPLGAGWRDFIDYWHTQSLDPDAYWAYIDQLQWYDEQIQQDDYVVGATVFIAGALRGFESYEFTGDMGELFTQYLLAHPQVNE